VVESFSDEIRAATRSTGLRHARERRLGHGAEGKVRRAFGLVAEAAHVDDGILLSSRPARSAVPARFVTLVQPTRSTVCSAALIGSPPSARASVTALRALHPRMHGPAHARVLNGSRPTRR
jgi:hypothetical protein